MVWRFASDAPGGFLAFSRIGGPGGLSEIVVIVNPGGGGAFTLPKLAIGDRVPGRKYVNALSPQQVATTAMDGSTPVIVFPANFSVPGGSTAVFVHQDAVVAVDSSSGRDGPLTCRH